jgi:hypothetical protein
MKVKEQPEVRKDMDVIEHDKTIQHTYSQMKVKEQLEVRKDIDVVMDSLSCSITSISFLTSSCSFTLICTQV